MGFRDKCSRSIVNICAGLIRLRHTHTPCVSPFQPQRIDTPRMLLNLGLHHFLLFIGEDVIRSPRKSRRVVAEEGTVPLRSDAALLSSPFSSLSLSLALSRVPLPFPSPHLCPLTVVDSCGGYRWRMLLRALRRFFPFRAGFGVDTEELPSPEPTITHGSAALCLSMSTPEIVSDIPESTTLPSHCHSNLPATLRYLDLSIFH